MTTPKIPPAKVIELYQEMCGAMVKDEVLLMQVLRHPTATDERVAEAVRSYRTSYAVFLVVRNSLRKHFPQPGDIYNTWSYTKKLYPWNRD